MSFPNEHAFDAYFWAAAQAQAGRTAAVGVDASMLYALAKAHAAQESGFSPTAYNFDGPDLTRNASRGIMQIEGATAEDLGLPTGADSDTESGPSAPHDYAFTTVPGRVTGMYDPALAIPVGVRLIADNVVATGGDIPRAIAAYNEGLSHALRDAPPYDNAKYVNRVTAYLQDYAAEGPPDGAGGSENGAGSAPTGGGASTGVIGGLVAVLVAGLAWLVARR